MSITPYNNHTSADGNVFPVSIDYSALLESGYSSTGAMATNATIALGWKPTKATAAPLISMDGHYALTIRKVGTTITVWKGGTELDTYGGSVGSTYAELVNNVLTYYGGAEEGYYSRVLIEESSQDYSRYWDASDLVTGLFIPKSTSGLTLHTLLDFSNAADLGEDSSGNGNDWTVSGAQFVDTPTDNACVLNALATNAGTLSNGNLTLASGTAQPTLQPESGKWSYKKDSVEVLYDADVSGKFEPDLSSGTYEFTGYIPTSGYSLITTTNLPDPTILKSAEYVETILFTAPTAGDQDVEVGFNVETSDWLSIDKNRKDSESWKYIDTERGLTKQLSSDSTAVESTVSALTTSGSTLTIPDSQLTDGDDYLLTILKAGIDQGFYQEANISHTNGSATPITHGLGASITWGIVRRTDSTGDWWVFAGPLGEDYYGKFTTAAFVNSAGFWSTNTSTTFDIPSSLATGTYVAYLFTDSDIFEAFSYTGNGNADGPFVNLGGRPLNILFLKNSDEAVDWNCFDAARSPFNTVNDRLKPNVSESETTSTFGAFTSIGCKVQDTTLQVNGANDLMIGLAIIESKKYSNAF